MEKSLKICFVCSGNTCRSVMAERLLKARAKQAKITGLKISSKGLNATGQNITLNAKLALKSLGVNSKDRKSVKLKKVEPDTLYIAMTEGIKQKIGGKVLSAKDLIGRDIADPYLKDLNEYLYTCEELKLLNEVLIQKILKVRSKK